MNTASRFPPASRPQKLVGPWLVYFLALHHMTAIKSEVLLPRATLHHTDRIHLHFLVQCVVYDVKDACGGILQ